MSTGTQQAQQPQLSLWDRVERYGPAALLLVVLALWAKPHADNIISDHREFMKQTKITQQQQAETQAVGVKVLDELKTDVKEGNGMLRDLRSRVVYGQGPGPHSESGFPPSRE